MPRLADYHMHTPLCHHAKGEPTEYVQHAKNLGLLEIGFSEHCPMPRDDFDDWHMYDRDMDRYFEKLAQARADHSDFTIKTAMEVDYLPGMESWIEGLQKRANWDYFIGSVHYLDETWDIDNPNKMEFWKAADPDEVWTKYFERLAQAAATGYFHIMGHMDLPKKFCFYPKGNLDPVVSKFLETVKAHDVAIELNTAGLRKDCREIYPSRHYLEMAYEIGVAITFGSDAHAPEEVGADFDQAIEMAKSVGYRSTRVFTQRSYELVEI